MVSRVSSAGEEKAYFKKQHANFTGKNPDTKKKRFPVLKKYFIMFLKLMILQSMFTMVVAPNRRNVNNANAVNNINAVNNANPLNNANGNNVYQNQNNNLLIWAFVPFVIFASLVAAVWSSIAYFCPCTSFASILAFGSALLQYWPFWFLIFKKYGNGYFAEAGLLLQCIFLISLLYFFAIFVALIFSFSGGKKIPSDPTYYFFYDMLVINMIIHSCLSIRFIYESCIQCIEIF